MSYAQFVNQWRTRRIGGGSAAAFLYRTGGTGIGLEGMTATRADSTTCARYQDASGIWQLAPANVLRSSHYIGGVITTLREGAGTNSALGACSFGDTTYWSNNGTMTLASATSCIAGQTATKHTCASAGSSSRQQIVGTFVNGQADCLSMIIEDVDATDASLAIRDATALATLVRADFVWATKAISIGAGSGTCGAIDLGGGRWRIWVVGTGTAAGTGAAGNSRQVILYVPGIGATTLSAILHHAQFEAASSYPSSPIVTVAGAVTRAADLISVPWSRNPEAGTWYVDAYDLGSVANGGVFFIGTSTSATKPRQFLYRPSTKWTNFLDAAAGSSSSAAAASSAIGDRVEWRPFLTVSGGTVTATLGQSINGAAEAVAAAGTARAIDAAWASPTRLSIGTFSDGTLPANLAIRALCYVPGPETSQATMRQIVNS